MNPYWVLNENSTDIDGNRFYGNANLAYKFSKKFSVSYQAGGEYRNEKIKSHGAIVSFEPGSAQDIAKTIPTVGGVTERSSRI